MVPHMAANAGTQLAQPTEAGWIADATSFGARLVLVRQRMGWSNVTEAARQCGLHAESWRLWEQGRMPSRLTTIAKTIATRSGCDYLWLVHGPDRGQTPSTGPYPAPRVLSRRKPRSRDVAAHALPATRPVRQTRPFGQPSRRQPIDV